MHVQLTAQLRLAIQRGQLRPGWRLPSTRTLAAELQVARVTVGTAYDQLVAEGYLLALPRRGTIVAEGLPEQGFARDPRTLGRTDPGTRFPEVNPWTPASPVTEEPGRGYELDLGPERFSLDFLGDRHWQRLLAEAWRQIRREPDGGAASYFGAFGDQALRGALAEYLAVRRAVRCRADQVVVTAGSTGALAAVARAWLGPGRVCVVEDPGGEQIRRTLAGAGGHIVAVATDENGLRVDLLPSTADVVLVTPSWQYPGGGILPLERRLRLLDWARSTGALVIEDDCESELRYDGEPLPSLQGLAEDGRVLYVSTFSKVLFPGLRTGYAIVPDDVRGPYLAAVEAGGRGPGVLEQRALALLLTSGGFDRHVQRLRRAYGARRDAFVGALKSLAGAAAQVRPASGGGHLVIRLNDERWTAARFVTAMAARGIRIESLDANRLGAPTDREVVVYYSRHGPETLRNVARTMAQILAQAPSA